VLDVRLLVPLIAPLMTACAVFGDPLAGLGTAEPGGPLDAYRLIGGDEIEIVYTGAAELNERSLLPLDGRIDLPLVGPISAAGRTPSDLARDIQERMAGVVVDVDVAVLLRSAAGSRVSVGGAVSEPGRYLVHENRTVGDALRAAGGVSRNGIAEGVVLLRGAGRADPVAYAVRHGDLGSTPSDAVPLHPGDVLFAPLSRTARLNHWVELYVNRNIPRTLYAIFWYAWNSVTGGVAEQ
jgi:polysaccharide export outer membrane protein